MTEPSSTSHSATNSKPSLFVLYDADSAQNKRQPKIKGVRSFAQIQSVKQRKADGLRRLRRDPVLLNPAAHVRCSACSLPIPSLQYNDVRITDDLGCRCDQRATEAFFEATPLVRLPLTRAHAMDPFNSGAVQHDQVTDSVEQYCESSFEQPALSVSKLILIADLRNIWPTIWPYESSRTRSLPIYDWIVPRFLSCPTTLHVRLFTGISSMSLGAGAGRHKITAARVAGQKSKALERLRSDISDNQGRVDGGLVLNVAVLCHVAVSRPPLLPSSY